MKFFVVFACALAVASAGYYPGPQHLPVIGPNGVPIDTADVQYARAAHLAHKIEAHARNGDYLYGHAAPIYGYSHPYAYGQAYPTTAVLPSSVNGVPLETPEVVAAKVNHFAAHAEALARNVHAIHYRKRRGIYAAYATQHLPIINHEGVPVDTAEVQIARAQHLAHKVEAHVRNGDYAVATPVVAAYAHHAAPIVASSYSHGYAAAPWAHYY